MPVNCVQQIPTPTAHQRAKVQSSWMRIAKARGYDYRTHIKFPCEPLVFQDAIGLRVVISEELMNELNINFSYTEKVRMQSYSLELEVFERFITEGNLIV